MLTINLDLTEQLENKINLELKKQNLSVSEYIQKLISNELDSSLELAEGFSYNQYI